MKTGKNNNVREIAALLNEGNQVCRFRGKHFGWMWKNIPEDYLNWMANNVDQIESRNMAAIELFRRGKSQSATPSKSKKHKKRKPRKRTKTLQCTSCGIVRESDGNEILHAAGPRCTRCGSRMDLKFYRYSGKMPPVRNQTHKPIRLMPMVID